MCIFNKPVSEVKQTRILVSPTRKGRALVIYENYVGVKPGQGRGNDKNKEKELLEKQALERESQNAMILPVPLRSEESDVELLDLSKGAFKFDDCDKCFPKKIQPQQQCLSSRSSAPKSSKLEVIAVGAYNMSIAKNLDDLYRIDETVFKVDPNVSELLKIQYGKGFGFVICCFDSNKNIEPHPIGYVGDFQKDGTMFVPCRHEHGHGTKDFEQFDHKIYSVNSLIPTNSSADQNPGQSVDELIQEYGKLVMLPTMKPDDVFSSEVLREVVPGVLAFRRKTISGKFKNTDLSFFVNN